MSQPLIRPATEPDAPAIAELYRACYGEDYPFTCFYDPAWIKRGVYDREIRWVVAEVGGRLLGSAAIMLAAGDADDQIGELGRLVVHPDARGLRLGTRLVEAIIAEADRYCDFSFAECRTAHLGSQKIFERSGYHAVGIEPLCYRLQDHETVTFVVRLSAAARALREPRPQVIPAAFELASLALNACGVPVDVEAAADTPYPSRRDPALEIGPMDEAARFRLLRLSRANALDPVVFGATRLEHGNLKLQPAEARFAVLRRGETVLGGLGYTWDAVDRKLRIFQLAAVDAPARGALTRRGIAWLEATYDPRYLVIDASGHAPAMQATLHDLGFAPVAWLPSMVYTLGRRYDVLRMVKLRMDPDLRHWRLTDASRPSAELAERAILAVQKGTLRRDALRQVEAFADLTDLELERVARECRVRTLSAGESVFAAGDPEQALFVVLSGEVQIEDGDAPLTIGPGEVFGEVGLIAGLPYQVGAIATATGRVLVMAPDDFDHLLAAAPDIGVRILRRLAAEIAQRARRHLGVR